jgi:hypothetical protein
VRWCRLLATPVAIALTLAGCGDTPNPAAPAPPSPPMPVTLEQSGPVEIVFLDATPSPGATITGCGTHISRCERRVVMRFALHAREAGSVLGVHAFLHATNRLACLMTSTGPFELARAETRQLAIVFDRSANCPVPLDIATMAVVVEGTVEVASRRAWTITYTFAP